MSTVQLKVYVRELRSHKGIRLYEWLLEAGKKQKLECGMATRGIAGFGSDGAMLEERFFESGSDVPIEITFMTTEKKAHAFLKYLSEEGLTLSSVLIPCLST